MLTKDFAEKRSWDVLNLYPQGIITMYLIFKTFCDLVTRILDLGSIDLRSISSISLQRQGLAPST